MRAKLNRARDAVQPDPVEGVVRSLLQANMSTTHPVNIPSERKPKSPIKTDSQHNIQHVTIICCPALWKAITLPAH